MKTSEIDTAYIEKYPGNVFHVTIKPGTEVTLESARRLINATNQMLDDTTTFRGGVYDLSRIAYIHPDAREYLAEGNDIQGTVAGVALLSNSFLGKMVGNLFISLGSPNKFPVKYFESPIRAEFWIRQQICKAKENEQSNMKHVA